MRGYLPSYQAFLPGVGGFGVRILRAILTFYKRETYLFYSLVCTDCGCLRINKRERTFMKIGIGLPASIPNVQGSFLLDWAKKADNGPFSSLGIIDRLVYNNY